MPDYSLWCYSDILLLFQVVEQPKFTYKVQIINLQKEQVCCPTAVSFLWQIQVSTRGAQCVVCRVR